MGTFESYELVCDEHPNSFIYERSEVPAYERWESPWYCVELEGRDWDGGCTVRCASKDAPFDVMARPEHKDTGRAPYMCISFHRALPLYTPEEVVGALAQMEEPLVQAAEVCRLIEEKVPELFPGFAAYTPIERKSTAEPVMGRSISDLQLVCHEVGAFSEVAVFGCDWLQVTFTRVDDVLLDVMCHRSDLKLRIEARAQPINSYRQPLLFLEPHLVFLDHRRALQELAHVQADAPLAVEVCVFLREQVDELFPDFIL